MTRTPAAPADWEESTARHAGAFASPAPRTPAHREPLAPDPVPETFADRMARQSIAAKRAKHRRPDTECTGKMLCPATEHIEGCFALDLSWPAP